MTFLWGALHWDGLKKGEKKKEEKYTLGVKKLTDTLNIAPNTLILLKTPESCAPKLLPPHEFPYSKMDKQHL